MNTKMMLKYYCFTSMTIIHDKMATLAIIKNFKCQFEVICPRSLRTPVVDAGKQCACVSVLSALRIEALSHEMVSLHACFTWTHL